MAVAQRATQNHYETLGVPTSASLEEIRRAYRILARRYHPDVNPGKSSEEKFKLIAEAYRVLSDEAKRREFDHELDGLLKGHFDRGKRAYEQAIRNAAAHDRARRRFEQARAHNQHQAQHQGSSSQSTMTSPPKGAAAAQAEPSLFSSLRQAGRIGAKVLRGFSRDMFANEEAKTKAFRRSRLESPQGDAHKVSVIEMSLTLRDALLGGRKSVEITEPEGPRKISIRIPPGVRNGTVLRTRARNSAEELVVIVRVAAHPFLRLEPKGLICEVPVTVQEALLGASITVPTLDEPVVLKVPPGSQSGLELRLKERGAQHADGSRGDLLYRLLIRVPEAADAVGLKDKAAELEQYYGAPVRSSFPKRLLDD